MRSGGLHLVSEEEILEENGRNPKVLNDSTYLWNFQSVAGSHDSNGVKPMIPIPGFPPSLASTSACLPVSRRGSLQPHFPSTTRSDRRSAHRREIILRVFRLNDPDQPSNWWFLELSENQHMLSRHWGSTCCDISVWLWASVRRCTGISFLWASGFVWAQRQNVKSTTILRVPYWTYPRVHGGHLFEKIGALLRNPPGTPWSRNGRASAALRGFLSAGYDLLHVQRTILDS